MEKITFFKRLKIALIDLEEYVKFLGEKFSKSIFFILKISLILSIIFSISNIAYVFYKYNSISNFIQTKVPDFSIVDGKLEIAEQDKESKEKHDALEVMEEIDDYIDLKIVNDGYNRDSFIKDINDNLGYIIVTSFLGIFLANLIELIVFWLFNAIMTSIVGELLLLMSRIKMKYRYVYAMSIYASTLSMILTVIYSIIRMYFDIYIDIFDYIYIIISYIYITAVILMIRAELIKQQIEIIKIVAEKKEKKLEETKEDNQEEKNKKEDKDEEKKENKKDKDKGSDDLDDEPGETC